MRWRVRPIFELIEKHLLAEDWFLTFQSKTCDIFSRSNQDESGFLWSDIIVIAINITIITIKREPSLHDGVGADRAHGKEVENREEDQHCLLKLDFSKFQTNKSQLMKKRLTAAGKTCVPGSVLVLTRRSTMLKMLRGAQEKKNTTLTPIRILELKWIFDQYFDFLKREQLL